MAQQKKSQRHHNAIKAHRQSVKRNLRNRTVKKSIRLAAKATVEAGQTKDPKNTAALSKAYSLIDRAARTGAIHWKAAARKKARLAHRLAKELSAVAPASKAK